MNCSVACAPRCRVRPPRSPREQRGAIPWCEAGSPASHREHSISTCRAALAGLSVRHQATSRWPYSRVASLSAASGPRGCRPRPDRGQGRRWRAILSAPNRLRGGRGGQLLGQASQGMNHFRLLAVEALGIPPVRRQAPDAHGQISQRLGRLRELRAAWHHPALPAATSCPHSLRQAAPPLLRRSSFVRTCASCACCELARIVRAGLDHGHRLPLLSDVDGSRPSVTHWRGARAAQSVGVLAGRARIQRCRNAGAMDADRVLGLSQVLFP